MLVQKPSGHVLRPALKCLCRSPDPAPCATHVQRKQAVPCRFIYNKVASAALCRTLVLPQACVRTAVHARDIHITDAA